MAVFPFHVGKVSWGLAPIILGLAALAQLGYWFANGSLKRWYKSVMALVPFFLLFSATPNDVYAQDLHMSESGAYKASLRSEVSPIPLNKIHNWVVHLETADGKAVADAELVFSGGMPLHNHGLPTEPLVTKYLGSGDYQVEGVRFHMQGDWELILTISDKGVSDTVRVALHL